MKFNKEKYEIMLTKLDNDNSMEVILNGNEDNAQSLFYQLISGANKTVNIISSKLELYNTNKIIQALDFAIMKGVQFKIILDGSDIDKNNNFLIRCIKSQNCTVKFSSSHLDFHILTRDSKAYRYCSNANNHTAIACFNGIKISNNADNGVFGTSYNNLPNYI